MSVAMRAFIVLSCACFSSSREAPRRTMLSRITTTNRLASGVGVEAGNALNTVSIRRNSWGSKAISSSSAVQRGSTRPATARKSSLLAAASSSCSSPWILAISNPLASKAAIVFSNVGGAGLATMAATSWRFMAMACRHAASILAGVA